MNKATFVVAPEFLCGLAALLREGRLLGAGKAEPFIVLTNGRVETDIDLFMEDYLRDHETYIRESGGCPNLTNAWGWSEETVRAFTWEWVFDGSQSKSKGA